ncbi:MAG: SAM hydrolase/SAM-dependent halogenase family protein, partial [Myxococcota bacterium]
MERSTVALLTDFGLHDNYVGIMKCVMADICPGLKMLDICHEVPPQNVLSGAFLLTGSARFLPDDSVVLGVVDPGVGSGRRAIALDFGGFQCVGPDNGLFDMLRKQFPLQSAWELTNTDLHLDLVSSTFHGRDIFAPVAAHLADGLDISQVGEQLDP